jgi:PPOX class probable F420-dependent enzyme
MSVEIPEKFMQRLQNAEYIWFTTVRADGMPQPTPVWFVWDNGTFLIYSNPQAQKVRNIINNPRVALSFNDNPDASEYLVIMGEAQIDSNTPSPVDMAAYHAKYKQGIIEIGMNDDSFRQTFSAPIRVTPVSVRGE